MPKIVGNDDYIDILSGGIRKEIKLLTATMKFKKELHDNFHNNILGNLDRKKYFKKMAEWSRLHEKKVIHAVSLTIRSQRDRFELKKKKVATFKNLPYHAFFRSRKKYETLTSREEAELRNISIRNWILSESPACTSTMIANQLFFATELICKEYCALECMKFACKAEQESIVQHGEVWKTLKQLSGDKNNESCRICSNRRNCRFNFGFRNLANIYAYSIKIRMLCDYSEELYRSGRDKKLSTYIDRRYGQTYAGFLVTLDDTLLYIFDDFMWTPFPLRDQVTVCKGIDF